MTSDPTPATLGQLATESEDPRFARIDEMTTAELAETMNDADATVPATVRGALPAIVAAIEDITPRMAAGGRMIYVGAGTSGRIGVLDASECPTTFGTDPQQVQAVMAGGASAITSPVEGAEDDLGAGESAIDHLDVAEPDCVIGIASSGRTPFVLGALRRARSRGALTVGLSGNADAPLHADVDHAIELFVGPEVIAGSTRLKAGTAQKLVLNMLSTIVMVQLGKTYGNLMIDVQPTNHKLRERAVNIVQSLTSADDATARSTLEDVGFDVKRAVIVLALGIDPADAARRLERAGGRLKTVLEAAP
ncbi:N-acetylmuramic acid 6-phosphate etherase [soil metagenome]